MSYFLQITKTAENDLINAANYIEYSLKNPIAADNFLDDIEKQINSLKDYPERHPIINDPVLSAWGIRLITVNNYIIFYAINGNTINILRILYGKRDWITILNQEYNN